jgi:hypothetical protein
MEQFFSLSVTAFAKRAGLIGSFSVNQRWAECVPEMDRIKALHATIPARTIYARDSCGQCDAMHLTTN